MPRYDELKTVRKLSDRGDTNSVVHLVKEANADNLYVRKPEQLFDVVNSAFHQAVPS